RAMTSSEPRDPQKGRVTQFRFGELLVLFQRIPQPDEVTEDLAERFTRELNDPDFYAEMRQRFSDDAGVQLVDYGSIRDREGKPAQSFATWSRSGNALGFGRVAVEGWRPDLEHIDYPDGNPPGLEEADKAVASAYERLSENRGQITVGNW